VWSSIAYDQQLDRVFCTTGNPNPEQTLGTTPYSCGILALDASTGEHRGFFGAFPESNYRPTDQDVDFGGSPTLFDFKGRRLIAAGCKNGSLFVVDAATLALVNWRQLLPKYKNGCLIPTVDPPSAQNPEQNENFSGTFSTPAVHAELGRMYIGLGGPNSHVRHAGIDYTTTPFLRALDWETLEDAWEMDSSDPPKYRLSQPPMYQTPSESGLSSPTIVNDVVFSSTSKIALYAFNAHTGELLWEDRLGEPTGGPFGRAGNGYCVGAAISGDTVVAGGLVFGRGGVLRIYKL